MTEALERVARDRRDADADMKAEWGKVDGASLYGHAWGYMTNAFNHVDAALSATPKALTTWLAEMREKVRAEGARAEAQRIGDSYALALDASIRDADFARGVEAAIAKVEEALTYDLKGGRDGYIGRVPDGEFISREYLLDALKSLIPSTNKEPIE